MKMKKILSLALVLVMVLSVVALVGCVGDKEPSGDDAATTLKFGMGVSAGYGEKKNADGETNGAGQVDADIAAVLVDADGKIVKCVLDTVQNKVAFTSEGKGVELGEFKTKHEQGTDYGMSAAKIDKNGDGVTKEWNEQADDFVKLVEGKTIEEVKALMAEDGYGVADVQTAGCTIHVSGFVSAIEKAVAAAVDSKATKDDTLKLGIVSKGTITDATAEKDGLIQVDSTIVAAVTDAEGKVVISSTDCFQAKFDFTAKGEAKEAAELKTKKELGKDYGMEAAKIDKNGDGIAKEWDAQAADFDAALVGKTATEITALAAEDGYGVADIQTAGCTINIGDMVKAAVKAATVA